MMEVEDKEQSQPNKKIDPKKKGADITKKGR